MPTMHVGTQALSTVINRGLQNCQKIGKDNTEPPARALVPGVTSIHVLLMKSQYHLTAGNLGNVVLLCFQEENRTVGGEQTAFITTTAIITTI